ncbi:cell division cycle-associated 7-like protein isoform X2 [Selaginella moellendorffii]|uniref:cell division cycle-associated 7-like protein isoform X2 n=1 Tax=Selaginella moellendorffii TaxID=88036 RepID=UPI000D1CF4DD|nr:cell division cycle-associated 7-like protein isoform X2 [Selaginella moellendorffii]|eukprot:XP_024532038.1 cell division cycle-associated 7-like protein isoform X2 [Selaginella moellendorffii]
MELPELADRKKRARRRGYRPEIYTQDHEKLLGYAKEEWKHIGRIYDDENTNTCHQCRQERREKLFFSPVFSFSLIVLRQKTKGPRSYCEVCKTRYQFCGDCLYKRYGENVNEVLGDENWKCPVCRDICNCSRCRRRKGWAPTGLMARRAIELGYKSVAHFLILTRRSGTHILDGPEALRSVDTNKRPKVRGKEVDNALQKKNHHSEGKKRKKKRQMRTVEIIIVEDEDPS